MCWRPEIVGMSRETERCLLLSCEFQMGGIPIKSIHPELSPHVKARRLSDNHMWSTAQRSRGFLLHYHFNNCATNLYNADPYDTVQDSLCL